MRNISLKQIIIVILVFFLLFGDFFNLKKKVTVYLNDFKNYVNKKNRKKRI